MSSDFLFGKKSGKYEAERNQNTDSERQNQEVELGHFSEILVGVRIFPRLKDAQFGFCGILQNR